ncbi:MAG: hypothetical protein QOK10_2768 [Pseudonocardiales bacterium]|nr:hypothetical protein [Pseudonocardiales bacterium]
MARAHKPKAGFWIRLCVIVLYPLNALLFSRRWHDLARIPPTGGVLLAANHISQADTAAMAVMVWQAGRIPRFLIKSGVFSWPVVGRVMKGAGQIPVYRGSLEARDSLVEASKALQRGECVIIYPEGTITRDRDYWPMAGRTGVARLALANPDVPVFPVGQWGAHRTLGRGGSFHPLPRQRHEARVGPRLDISRYRGRAQTPELLTEVTAEVMTAITVEVTELRKAEGSADRS